MKKMIIGIIVGSLIGIIDVIPMILQKLTWDANISAFSMWVVIGLFVSLYNYKIPTYIGSIITAFLVLLPCAIIIGWKEPFSLIPISVMTLVLSFLLGLVIRFIKQRMNIE
ncbi:MAG TPA: hypothetical protein PLE45_08715 [Spirochaetota bacterium]|nr:hypothetical protein [Spirochaetota bacterium]HOL57187.1 hypothetical protein [Spirochaetota bacterium]HPP04825.1 hypothetical protein [Spirochaetota bacterium]